MTVACQSWLHKARYGSHSATNGHRISQFSEVNKQQISTACLGLFQRILEIVCGYQHVSNFLAEHLNVFFYPYLGQLGLLKSLYF